MITVMMGVGGCGKTTLGRALAESTGRRFLEGDDHHAAESLAKMTAGVSLDDRDRLPWLRSIRKALCADEPTQILSCSALKRSYRDVLGLGIPMYFVHLDVPMSVARRRMEGRSDHFFPASLIESQFGTLQPLDPDEPGVTVDGTLPLPDLARTVLSHLRESFAHEEWVDSRG